MFVSLGELCSAVKRAVGVCICLLVRSLRCELVAGLVI